MPFDLTNAPVVFQALINNILCDMPNHCVFLSLCLLPMPGPGDSSPVHHCRHPSFRSSYLLLIELSHNSLTILATGMSPFMAVHVSAPPLTCSGRGRGCPIHPDSSPPLSEGFEDRLSCSYSLITLYPAPTDLLCSPAPHYQPGKKVWLSSHALPC